MAEVIVYSTRYCAYCHAAKGLLADKGVIFTEIDLTGNSIEREALRAKVGGRSTVPQIFIAGNAVGGYDELVALEGNGELDALLEVR